MFCEVKLIINSNSKVCGYSGWSYGWWAKLNGEVVMRCWVFPETRSSSVFTKFGSSSIKKIQAN